MKSLPAYIVTMLTLTVTNENEMQKAREVIIPVHVWLLCIRLYSALALGPAPKYWNVYWY